ncbi:MAG: zinc-ribbon domain-containing protein [Vicinamibacterales bacterium]
MTCSQCGATIADKALICYKCGTQTTAPRHQPAAVRPGGGWIRPVMLVVVLAVLLGLAWQAGLFGPR